MGNLHMFLYMLESRQAPADITLELPSEWIVKQTEKGAGAMSPPAPGNIERSSGQPMGGCRQPDRNHPYSMRNTSGEIP